MTQKKLRQAKTNGFTIVELLIVIVVVGILAAITIVSYQGIQRRASNLARHTEAKDWQKLLVSYAAINNGYPTAPVGTKYCLGTGFPEGTGGQPRCHNYRDNNNDENGISNMYYPPDPTNEHPDKVGINVLESYNTTLMNQLKTIEPNLPNNGRQPIGAFAGPWLYYKSSRDKPEIYHVFSKSSSTDDSCPEGMTLDYRGSQANVCMLELP